MAKHKCSEGTWELDQERKLIFTHCQSCYERMDIKGGPTLYEAYSWGREEALLEAAHSLKDMALKAD